MVSGAITFKTLFVMARDVYCDDIFLSYPSTRVILTISSQFEPSC